MYQALSVIPVVTKVSGHTFVNYLLVSLMLSEGHEPHDCLANKRPEFDNTEKNVDGRQLAYGVPLQDGADTVERYPVHPTNDPPPQTTPQNYPYVCGHCGRTGQSSYLWKLFARVPYAFEDHWSYRCPTHGFRNQPSRLQPDL
jgi:hypothetical protein